MNQLINDYRKKFFGKSFGEKKRKKLKRILARG